MITEQDQYWLAPMAAALIAIACGYPPPIDPVVDEGQATAGSDRAAPAVLAAPSF